MRQIIMDTETTGLEPAEGHNIIEIGCVEMVGRKLTGRTYHRYIKPDREVDQEAIEVHGITNEFLADKPRFAEIAQEFIDFIDGAELIIHNAAFDVGFMDTEFERNGRPERTRQICRVTDSLMLARRKHPGQKNNLDALCKRYGIDNSHRELHGALLDSEILADVYLALTGGQLKLDTGEDADSDDTGESRIRRIEPGRYSLRVVAANDEELKAHQAFLSLLAKKSGGPSVWEQVEDEGKA
ncbi:DNA polymerase III subunit epsilon [Marinobacterium nitratireducens]|uniref:DNA polymerase III subunit epsilon n=1 Tax=Marinobacterium nitratireducens TaxID=518897 RepID=A0A918DSI3_9GAMM|nr:DNA polymerase III subunit epsilon [Marinobacterium nitratireducens]GGO80580.1 DNA polymerase III subunit epsilon [Marinobacterium nitratireducens]